jgi:threonine dehydratase
VAIDSGANVNFDRLRHIAERSEIGENREAILAVTIPEHPGSFKAFCKALGKRNITEFNYRYAHTSKAHVFAGLQISGSAEREKVVTMLRQKGYTVVDMSDNEMAKLHIRHMVGGHSEAITNEVLFRFEFPERPGALLNFLSGLGQRWNISLFHYRNHGAAYGRVLVGMQVPSAEKKDFTGYLQSLNYRYWEETANPAYHTFL